MTHFNSALKTWFDNHPQHSARFISLACGINQSQLIQYRSGNRAITFDAISKLLPTIERYSDRASAVTLLIAYLRDETPATHANAVRIEAIDHKGQPQADVYQKLARRWEEVARTDPDFMTMWQGLDSYMHTPEAIVTRSDHADPQIALLSEAPPDYKA